MSMEQNFVASTRNLVRRPWTVATSAFSHDDTRHLLFNMLSLYMMGMGLAQSRMIGGRVLLGVYVLGGVASSLSHIASARFSRDPWAAGRGCVGASGSVMALSVCFLCCNMHRRLKARIDHRHSMRLCSRTRRFCSLESCPCPRIFSLVASRSWICTT